MTRADTFLSELVTALARSSPAFRRDPEPRAPRGVAGRLDSVLAGRRARVLRGGRVAPTVVTTVPWVVRLRLATALLAVATVVASLLVTTTFTGTGLGRGHLAVDPEPTSDVPGLPVGLAGLGCDTIEGDVTSFSDVERMPVLPADEVRVYRDAGAGETRFVSCRLADGTGVLVLAVRTPDATSARTCAELLDRLQVNKGLLRVPLAPEGVLAVSGADSVQSTVLGHYTSDAAVIRVQAVGAGPGAEAVLRDFNRALTKQLQVAPARQ